MFRCLAVVMLLPCTTGCTSPETLALRTASRDFLCPEAALRVLELQDSRYRTVGCSQSRVYECDEDYDYCWVEGRLAAKARQRGTREFGCSPVKVRWIQDETYRVEACGQAVTYACDEERCVPEGSRQSTTFIGIPVPMGR